MVRGFFAGDAGDPAAQHVRRQHDHSDGEFPAQVVQRLPALMLRPAGTVYLAPMAAV